MNRTVVLSHIKAIVLLLISANAYAVDPRLNWNTINSQNFYIHYADGYERLAQKVANIAEQSHNKLSPQLNWQPEDKTHLVISDETDSANGFATPISFNRSVLFMAPPESASSLEDFDDWLETLITHEYTHVLHLDKVNGGAEGLRKVFGRQFFLFPNAYQPNWFTEGLATYYETDKQRGVGRGQSTLFSMMMRSEVENGIKPVSQVNLPNRSWPMGTIAYLYGVHFYLFIEDVYGKPVLDKLIENYSNNIIPFMINTNSQQVLNKDINELWVEFSVWLKARYLPEVEAQKNHGIIEGKKITNTGYTTGPVEMVNGNELIYVSSGVFEHTKLLKRQAGKDIYVAEVSRGAKINTHPEAGILITQNDFCDEYNINSDIYVLRNNTAKRLTECGRYRSASWSPDGENIIALKTDKGVSQLEILTKQGEKLKQLWTGNNTDIVTQIKMSPSGNTIVAAVFRTGLGWNIEEFNLKTLNWNSITRDKAIDMYPSYSDKGETIQFSSERSGRYQIHRYIKKTGEIQMITRVASGAFNPVQFDRDSPLYYVGYTSKGQDIYRLDNVQAITDEPLSKVGVKNDYKAAPEVNVSQAESYSAWSSLYPRWWFPFISLSDDRTEYGISTTGNDALGIHNYLLNIAYDTSNDWLVGDINYSYANRFSMGYQRSTDIFRDSAGEFALARHVNDVFLTLGYSDPGVERRIRYQLGAVVSASTDASRAPAVSEQDDTQDNLFGGAIIYDDTQKYIRSISLSDGRNIRMLAETTDVFDSDFSGEVYTLDWREFISLGKQNVLALRLVQGWGIEQPKPFRLGGEDGEFNAFALLFPLSQPLFNKRDYALRGYAEGHPKLTGRRMQLATIEWRFPGALIERGFMSPPVGIIQWSGSVFAETGAAYNDSAADEYLSSAGVELQAEINLFYGLTSQLRLGFASGFDNEIGDDRVYFNLGASF